MGPNLEVPLLLFTRCNGVFHPCGLDGFLLRRSLQKLCSTSQVIKLQLISFFLITDWNHQHDLISVTET